MVVVVPWPTPTSATTDATPMITPSIVRAARSRLVRSRDEGQAEQLEEGSCRATPPVAQVDLAVGGGRDVGVVGDEDDRPPAGVELAEDAEDLGAGVAVEVAGRLVGEDERRFGDEGARDGDPLLLAAATARSARGRRGRRARAAPAPPWRAGALALRATPWYSSGMATLSSAVVRGSRLYDWKTKPMVRLRSRASASSSSVGDRRAGEAVGARRRAVQAADDVHHRALARAGRADDRDELARPRCRG